MIPSDIKIQSPFDFSLILERQLREYKTKIPLEVLQKIEAYGQECFEQGFKCGKLPINRPLKLLGDNND